VVEHAVGLVGLVFALAVTVTAYGGCESLLTNDLRSRSCRQNAVTVSCVVIFGLVPH
jgi:hypothetical protein